MNNYFKILKKSPNGEETIFYCGDETMEEFVEKMNKKEKMKFEKSGIEFIEWKNISYNEWLEWNSFHKR